MKMSFRRSEWTNVPLADHGSSDSHKTLRLLTWAEPQHASYAYRLAGSTTVSRVSIVFSCRLAVRRQPEGLRHLVVADSLASSELWGKSVMQLLATLPKEVQEGMAAGMKEPKKYREALRQFHAKHGCLKRPIPADFDYALDQVFGENGDPTVAHAPILVKWSIIDRLHLIEVPTFVINGRLDIAQDFVVAPFFERIRKVKWVTLENSSHTPFFEDDRDRALKSWRADAVHCATTRGKREAWSAGLTHIRTPWMSIQYSDRLTTPGELSIGGAFRVPPPQYEKRMGRAHAGSSLNACAHPRRLPNCERIHRRIDIPCPV
ncbi:hypothetical protein NUW54_g4084 [Trametes sanguinea]|uniref:Uncharacterized protein n=1 Tax=Trametes sanguinea TaxID=158606 RepID=A0ACC1PZ22_9APHY|nr:hypothetical protein NUW54_g4084 [Trametes sanguinea]